MFVWKQHTIYCWYREVSNYSNSFLNNRKSCCVCERILKTKEELRIKDEKLTNIANTLDKVRATLCNAIFMFLCP